jgi:hypothetical protein
MENVCICEFNMALVRWENITKVVRWGPTDPTK